MDNIKVSIIMPVYNVENYIFEALDSIKNQTFKNYEIILVDDGSEDKTAEICKAYCKIDERFQLIHQKNYGAAVARNNGAKRARGEYIIFLDSDDIFKNSFLEKMYVKIQEYNADVCICGFERIKENGQTIDISLPDISKARNDEEYLAVQSFSPWTKMCKKEFLEKNQVYFQNISSSNDVYYSVCAMLEANKIVYIQEALVKYRVMSTTFQISANRDPRNFGLACEELIRRYTGDCNLKKRVQIIAMCLRGMVSECRCCGDEKKNKAVYDFIKNYIINVKDCRYIKDRATLNAIQMIKGNEYSKEIINDLFSYEKQISINKKQILECLSPYKQIVLWGMGMRGRAFLKFCFENNVHIAAVADKENCDVGEKHPLGYEIIHTNKVFETADLVLACNNIVYDAIKDNKEGIKVLNLQHFF